MGKTMASDVDRYRSSARQDLGRREREEGRKKQEEREGD
jgi:hypothetical protein